VRKRTIHCRPGKQCLEKTNKITVVTRFGPAAAGESHQEVFIPTAKVF